MSADYYRGDIEFFPGIGRIPFEGLGSDNPLAFKHYDADRRIGNLTMREHLRFAVCYWHTFVGAGADPFGVGTRAFAWDRAADPLDAAVLRMDAAFELFTKLGVPYYCFHDRDMAPAGSTVAESESNLQKMVERAGRLQQQTGVRLLWGTANLFSHPRFMCGAATNPDFQVVAHAGAQVKAALDATVALGGENYVFWGGREGYSSLLNTDTARELDHLATFLAAARDYGRRIGFKGRFLIEPKPMEPMKHQYDFDAASVIGFLRQYGLDADFSLNIEANHATLAGHTFAHELQISANAGLLGSIDANRGDMQNGWDTDQFPVDLYDTTTAMMVVLEEGGLAPGGLNFDAKARRESVDMEDLFIGHIGGMDAFARGLEVAHALLTKSRLTADRNQRYESFDAGDGAAFAAGKLGLEALRDIAAASGEPALTSGKQERYENLLNQYLLK